MPSTKRRACHGELCCLNPETRVGGDESDIVGSKNIDQSAWTTWSLTKTSLRLVSCLSLRLDNEGVEADKTVEKFIDAGRLPHLLMYGPPGEHTRPTPYELMKQG